MSARNLKYILLTIWTASILLGLYTIFKNTPFSTLKTPLSVTGLLQRIFGITAFVCLFYQIILGSYMQVLSERVGGFIYKFHILQGVFVYVLILFHPVFFLIFNYFAGRGVDPYYVFTQVCVLCQNKGELYYSLGKASFWILNITVFSGLFRTMNHFMRVNWKKFHNLNYLVFGLISIHGYYVGSDFGTQPFFGMAMVFVLIYLYVLLFRKAPEMYLELKNWFRSN